MAPSRTVRTNGRERHGSRPDTLRAILEVVALKDSCEDNHQRKGTFPRIRNAAGGVLSEIAEE